LVISSNIGPVLSRFRDIAGFLFRTATPPLSHPNFGVFLLDKIADIVTGRSEDPKLSIRVINFELIQPICLRYINVTVRQSDGRTTYDSKTALCTTCIAR